MGKRERRISPLELPLELPLSEELLSLLDEPLEEVSPDAEALVSPVALALVSEEPLPPEEVALPPWVLETMNAAPSSVSPLLLQIKSQQVLQNRERRPRPPLQIQERKTKRT